MERFTSSVRWPTLAIALAAGSPLLAAPVDASAEIATDSDFSENVQIVTTLLGKVKRAAVNGREFLTLDIGRPVGPLACRGDVLRVELVDLGDVSRRKRIETTALSAVLDDRAVSVTVSLDAERCADGRPVFTDVRSLPTYP